MSVLPNPAGQLDALSSEIGRDPLDLGERDHAPRARVNDTSWPNDAIPQVQPSANPGQTGTHVRLPATAATSPIP
jgi:hypothetical protein